MINIERLTGLPVSEEAVECVERKGAGHPDTLADLLSEAVSVSLSKEYIRLFGAVLHHNSDKGFLAAGSARKNFQGGRIIKPMRFFIGDRATFKAKGIKVPVAEIAVEAAKKWMGEHMRFIEPDRHIVFHPELAPGSEQLAGIYAADGGRGLLGANDTSAAIGYWPLSPTEELVLSLEKFLNSVRFKRRYPETGEDVKVMAVREKKSVAVTIAMPLIDRFLRSEGEYFVRKEMVLGEIENFLAKNYLNNHFDGFMVHLNGLDTRGRGMAGIYASVLGTSAEDADSGQVGRGNRANGLISFGRPLTTEAVAGKNPRSHTGKIYGVLAHLLARKVFEGTQGLREVYVLLVSRIGMEINRPAVVSVKLRFQKGAHPADASKNITGIIEEELSEKKLLAFTRQLSQGKYAVC
ncbi:MAG: methionine adenosyltransferase [Nitrospiraceae bacterium]|nr:methionine adenosyltransferase [Nitrospiraceae bacterium]